MSYTLEPGDIDVYGKRYADIKEYDLSQDRLAALTVCGECGYTTDPPFCENCGRTIGQLSTVCENCEDIWGGDFLDDEPPMQQAFDANGPF